jgi:hypothetical protein
MTFYNVSLVNVTKQSEAYVASSVCISALGAPMMKTLIKQA